MVASEIEPGVWLLPAPLFAKATSFDPSAWMDQAATPAGAIRIGLAHGSVQGFGSAGEAAIPIDPGRPKRAGLAYLALGDWHGRQQINERTWYSGTPEPDQFLDNDPGHVLAVRVDGPRARPAVAAVATATYRWSIQRHQVTGDGDVAALERALAGAGWPLERMLVRLIASGDVSVTAAAAIGAGLDRVEASLCHLERDLSGLRVSAKPADLASLRDESGLLAAAQRLQSLADDPDSAQATDARDALALLFAFARGAAP